MWCGRENSSAVHGGNRCESTGVCRRNSYQERILTHSPDGTARERERDFQGGEGWENGINHCESRDFLLVNKNLSHQSSERGLKKPKNTERTQTNSNEEEREILENQQEITTHTVIWARQLVSPRGMGHGGGGQGPHLHEQDFGRTSRGTGGQRSPISKRSGEFLPGRAQR